MFQRSLILLALCFWLVPVAAAPSVQWGWIHYPPSSISSGPLKNQGIVDLWLKDLQQHALPGVTHRYVPMTPGRVWQLMKASETACNPAALYDKARDQFAVYSDPWNFIPEKVILMHRADAERLFPGQSSVSLAQLFAREDLRLGVVSDLTYYVHINAWLQNSVALEQAVKMSNQQRAYTLFRMLENDRIDYMIEYPWISTYYQKLYADRYREGEQQEIVSLAITELPQFTNVYVACTDNELGRSIVSQANRWIRQQWPKEKNRRYLSDWLDPASLERYLKAYELYIKPIEQEVPEP